MEYGKHPSIILQNIFMEKPYQIQSPENAKIIFLGLDPNLDKNIENDNVLFNEFVKYFSDGIHYWNNNNVHTPMLKPIYKGDGKKYHKNFAKLGFSAKNSEDICFIELLKWFTYGKTSKNNKLFLKMVNDNENKSHLERIRELTNKEKIICISTGVRKVINKIKLFDTFKDNIIIHTHFSDAITNYEIDNLRKKINDYL